MVWKAQEKVKKIKKWHSIKVAEVPAVVVSVFGSLLGRAQRC